MRLAISASGPALSDAVDGRFGRAAYFVLVDPATMEYEAIDNSTNRDALQGAGIAAAELVAEQKAEAVLTAQLGPKAFRALEAASIPAYAVSGMTVAEAARAFESGDLERLSEAGESKKGVNG
jgi:predicted Fe-Mo cluster-binding NifX family protein